MLLPLGALLFSHVPGYGGDCEFNCCHLPHPTRPDVSQAVYLRGTAGIEIDLVDIQDYIDESKDIEFSFVFKEEYDVWTYDMFVGCGGCASHRTLDGYHGWDEPNYTTNLLPKPTTYQPGVLEPFTQHAYFPLLPKGEARMFNAGQLKDCDSDHFSIRLVTYDNASHDLTYSIALGCEDGLQCERFTFEELFLFPLYVRRTHESHWNEAGYTLPIIAIVVIVLYASGLWFFFGKSWLALYEPVSILPPQKIYELLRSYKDAYNPLFRDLPCVMWKPSLRAGIYAIVVCALVIDIFESVTHVFIAVHALNKASQPYEARGVGLFIGVVLLFGKIMPLILVALVWRFHRAIPEYVWRTYAFKCMCNKWKGLGWYSPMWAHGAWSIIEIWFLGVAGLVWLGAGFWVFPFGMLIAGAFRLGIWVVNPDGYKRGIQFKYPEVDARWGGVGGPCSDQTKRDILEAYNRIYREDADDQAPLLAVADDAPLAEGTPMPATDDEPPPAYNTAARPAGLMATRPLSRAELVQLGRR